MASTTASSSLCRFCRNLLKVKPAQRHQLRPLSSNVTGRNRSTGTISYSHAEKFGQRTSRCLYSTGTDQNPTSYQENNETIIRSHYDDVEMVDKSFGEFMFSFLDMYKNLDAMVYFPTGQTFTCGQMKESAIKVASGLWKLGFRKGDVAILFANNCPEYTILFLACAIMGMPVSTANPVYTPGELARQMSHSGAKAMFTVEEMLPVVKEAIASSQEISSNIKQIFTFHSSPSGCFPFQNLMEDDGKEFPENVDIDPGNDILTLPYSSGTTGMPKGVMLTHTNLVMNLVQGMKGQMKFRPDEDVLMGLLPFYHIYGLMVLQFGSLTQGAKLVVVPKFEPETFLTAIQEYKITYAHLVPPVILFLAKYPLVENYNTSSLRTLVSAAAPLGTGVTMETEERIGCNLLQAYGLTECSPITHYDEYPHKVGTIGRLIPSTRAKIIDTETGKGLGVGETGELLIKGPQVMKGYFKNQAATDGCMMGDWFATGDIGHVDSEGYFLITDRMKELIKYKGLQESTLSRCIENKTIPEDEPFASNLSKNTKYTSIMGFQAMQVAPAELEALLCTHPAIQDAAVVGIPAGEHVGEVPRAFVVHKPGVSLKEDEVLSFVAANVAPYKKLRGGVEFVDLIPKTASGKILRRTLK